MRYEDLPLSLRSQVDDAVGKKATKRTRKATSEPGLPLACSRCGFVADPATEDRLSKHSAEFPGHGRFEWRPPAA